MCAHNGKRGRCPQSCPHFVHIPHKEKDGKAAASVAAKLASAAVSVVPVVSFADAPTPDNGLFAAPPVLSGMEFFRPVFECISGLRAPEDLDD